MTTLILSRTHYYIERIRYVDIYPDKLVFQHDAIGKDGTKMHLDCFTVSTEEFVKIENALKGVGELTMEGVFL